MFSESDQFVGGVASGAVPLPVGPRQWAQLSAKAEDEQEMATRAAANVCRDSNRRLMGKPRGLKKAMGGTGNAGGSLDQKRAEWAAMESSFEPPKSAKVLRPFEPASAGLVGAVAGMQERTVEPWIICRSVGRSASALPGDCRPDCGVHTDKSLARCPEANGLHRLGSAHWSPSCWL